MPPGAAVRSVEHVTKSRHPKFASSSLVPTIDFRMLPTARAKRLARLAPFALAAVVTFSCSRNTPPVEPQFVAEWMRNYYGLVRAERISPPVAARVLAYASVALHEGLAAAS